MLTFANPLGFLALLAVPAILAIHFLQRESRRLQISTLFLLENLPPESAQGRRFQRLRQSLPLWMQLLAAVLAAWMLAQPRWQGRDSVQRIVLVLDSSISLSAFKADVEKALAVQTARLAPLAATTEWQLLESDPVRPALYAGTERARLLQALAAWQPHLGSHDFGPTLRLAQTELRGTGTLIFVTDRPTTVPEGVHLLAVGRPLDNCGFTGASCEGRHWQALLKNYGRTPQQRSWWIEAERQKSPPQTITLPPGQALSLSGEIPARAKKCELVLSPDEFEIDDRLPLVAPEPKILTVAFPAQSPFDSFFQKLADSLENHAIQPAPADVQLVAYDPLQPNFPDTTSIVFTTDPSTNSKPATGELVAENHPLMAGLNWNGLLCRNTLQAPSKLGDQVLLWLGERPLIYLRENPRGRALVINFDLRSSNAPRLPAFILLLHRFAEQIRSAKSAPEWANVETNQLLSVAADPSLPPPVIAGASAGPLRAPWKPGFFQVTQGAKPVLTAAAQFADAREADFHDAARVNDLNSVAAQLQDRNSQPDFLVPVWLLLLSVALVVNWRASERSGP